MTTHETSDDFVAYHRGTFPEPSVGGNSRGNGRESSTRSCGARLRRTAPLRPPGRGLTRHGCWTGANPDGRGARRVPTHRRTGFGPLERGYHPADAPAH